MPDTTRLALPYPQGTDVADIPSDVQALAEALDPIVTWRGQGTMAARPTASAPGRLYWATDAQVLSLDNGTAWVDIGPSVIKDGAVTSVKIADDAVTTPKLPDDAITAGKIATGAVTSAKIASAAVTHGKIYPPDELPLILVDGWHSYGGQPVYAFRDVDGWISLRGIVRQTTTSSQYIGFVPAAWGGPALEEWFAVAALTSGFSGSRYAAALALEPSGRLVFHGTVIFGEGSYTQVSLSGVRFRP